MNRPRRASRHLAAVGAAMALLAGPALTDAAAADTGDSTSQSRRDHGTMVAGDRLSVGQELRSPNGQHRLTLQPDGNVVLSVTRTGRARWVTGTADQPARTFNLQHDGNLILRGEGRTVLWASNTGGHPGTRLSLTDDGSLLLSWPDGRKRLQRADDQLAPGETLRPGQRLVSPKGWYSLEMQTDGNLVQTERGIGPVWASGTRGNAIATLTPSGTLTVGPATKTGAATTESRKKDPLNKDGRKKKQKKKGESGGKKVRWSSGTDTPGTRLVVQDDGNLVMYDGKKVVWSRGKDERQRAESASAASLARTNQTLGNTYPDQDATPCGAGVYCKLGQKYSLRGFAYRNCTDFVAWKLGLTWSEIADGRNGHAVGWKQGWIERGRSVGTTPRVGSVAWWGRGSYGHVAYVVAVNPDGSAVVEQYNAGGTGSFSTQIVRAEAYLY